MKKNLLSKNLHQWLFLLVCFVATLPSWAEDYTEDGIIYDLDRSFKRATVKGLEDKSATSAEIKSNVAGCEVTSIRRQTFYYCSSLLSINIPSSVTSIGEMAFEGCSSLTSINIPSSVTSIGEMAFEGCSSLITFTVDANNPNYSAEGCMLFDKKKTELICAVGSQKTYDIPSSVTSIGGKAFRNCRSLTSINIPSSVTSIGAAAFLYCSSLTSINIPSFVTSIEDYAFYGCSSLTSINIPSSVTSIGVEAFSNCRSLTSINIPSSVTSIGGSAFFNCCSLTSINIPSSVTSIGEWPFLYCSSLTTFTVDANNPNYSAEGCMLFDKKKTELICAVGSQKTYDIPSSVTSIGGSAFEGCRSLTSINIPSSVTSIGGQAFRFCI